MATIADAAQTSCTAPTTIRNLAVVIFPRIPFSYSSNMFDMQGQYCNKNHHQDELHDYPKWQFTSHLDSETYGFDAIDYHVYEHCRVEKGLILIVHT